MLNSQKSTASISTLRYLIAQYKSTNSPSIRTRALFDNRHVQKRTCDSRSNTLIAANRGNTSRGKRSKVAFQTYEKKILELKHYHRLNFNRRVEPVRRIIVHPKRILISRCLQTRLHPERLFIKVYQCGVSWKVKY